MAGGPRIRDLVVARKIREALGGETALNELQGLNCLITGASRGLGKVLARASWEAGASLLLTARSRNALEDLVAGLPARQGQSATILSADLAEPSSPESIVRAARSTFPSLDVLVNNAAIQGPIGPVWENDWRAWTQAVQVDLLAPVMLCRLCVPWMAEGGRGKIINLSGGGAASARPRFSAYSVAKSALVRFTETLAEETRHLHIDVNCLGPGIMDSSMLDEIRRVGPDIAGEEEHRKAVEAHQHGETIPRRAAALGVFLASSGSDGITGKLISAVWDPWEELGDHRADLADSDVYTLRRILPKDRGWDWGERRA